MAQGSDIFGWSMAVPISKRSISPVRLKLPALTLDFNKDKGHVYTATQQFPALNTLHSSSDAAAKAYMSDEPVIENPRTPINQSRRRGSFTGVKSWNSGSVFDDGDSGAVEWLNGLNEKSGSYTNIGRSKSSPPASSNARNPRRRTSSRRTAIKSIEEDDELEETDEDKEELERDGETDIGQVIADATQINNSTIAQECLSNVTDKEGVYDLESTSRAIGRTGIYVERYMTFGEAPVERPPILHTSLQLKLGDIFIHEYNEGPRKNQQIWFLDRSEHTSKYVWKRTSIELEDQHPTLHDRILSFSHRLGFGWNKRRS